ncbi:MAG: universal stress protein [Anaerolinea sp.]|nr:universal stress protein [Anaerolinea sp.]
MFNNILLSFDGSEHAMNAARVAAQLALQQEHPFLWVVCVVEDIPDLLQEPYQSKLIAAQSSKGEALIDAATQIVGNQVEVKRQLLFGDPAECIINVAENRSCDLIVMGTRGLGPLRGLLLGSKAQKVVSLTKCPVLLTK